ncbi:MAG TPA: glycosyltransferase [Frankiaceae bacterium]|nr:glycosyltransferase [Frankiaceae bacterium]
MSDGPALEPAAEIATELATELATVVIVNWNGAHLLPACLDGLARQSDGRFHTWVVDNASTDGSVELLHSKYPHVRVLEAPRNLGFAGGNNFALHEVATPFAVLLNNDATPEPDWFARLLEPFEGPAEPPVGAVTGKVVFLPSFVRLQLSTDAFVPGPHDSRELGVRISSLRVDGVETLSEVLWERLTYGAEGPPDARFFWTRPSGELLVPIPRERPTEPLALELTWSGERSKTVTLSWDGGSADLPAGEAQASVSLELPADLPRVDVINNAGGVVLTEGYGADRAYQQIDDGSFDEAVEVFTACGNGMAMRTELGHRLGWFDDDFFLYYEDTDLSWRIRSSGYAIRYQPTAVLRHVHAASSKEGSTLFVFHVDRNRLLMLTKDASAALALRAVLRYPLTTASMAMRSIRQGIASRHRPAVRPTLLRLRVIASYLRLLPRMLNRRRQIGQAAATGRRTLEKRWLISPAEWTRQID